MVMKAFELSQNQDIITALAIKGFSGGNIVPVLLELFPDGAELGDALETIRYSNISNMFTVVFDGETREVPDCKNLDIKNNILHL